MDNNYDIEEVLGALFDDDEDLGFDDEIGYMDEIGAPAWMKKLAFWKKKNKKGKSSKAKSKARSILQKAISGQTAPTVGLRPIGLGAGTMTAAITTLNLTAVVQDPFQILRPVVVVSYIGAAGAAYTGSPATITGINVGVKNQLLGTAVLPADMFQPNTADNIALVGDIAGNGISVSMQFGTVAAVPAGESVFVVAAFLGKSAN